jgi:hypothetical protein
VSKNGWTFEPKESEHMGASSEGVGAEVSVIEQQGRRDEDLVVKRLNIFNDTLFEAERSILFWLFGPVLDHDNKPSMSRLMLLAWTVLGWLMVVHEMKITTSNGMVALNNAVWAAWWPAEAALAAAVFAPQTWGDTMKTIGAAAATSIGTAAREVIARREKAAAVGEPGTEYDGAPKK